MSFLFEVKGKNPAWGKNCFIAPNATLCGDVIMGDECSVWFNAVIRGDVNSIRMGNKVNIQDGAVIHCTYQHIIFYNASMHNCIVSDTHIISNVSN